MSKSESIGEFIKFRRKEKGLTLVDLQEASGVSNSYLSQIENGKFKPSSDILKKLATPLEISYYELMFKAGYIPKMYLDEANKLEKNLEFTKDEISASRLISDFYHKYQNQLMYDLDRLKMVIESGASSDESINNFINAIEVKLNELTMEHRSTLVKIKNAEENREKLHSKALLLEELLKEKLKAVNQNDIDEIQKKIDKHLGLIDEMYDKASDPPVRDITVTIPFKYEFTDKNLKIVRKRVSSDNELKELIFDLHYLMNADIDLFYEKKSISDEDKLKILTMLDMILK